MNLYLAALTVTLGYYVLGSIVVAVALMICRWIDHVHK